MEECVRVLEIESCENLCLLRAGLEAIRATSGCTRYALHNIFSGGSFKMGRGCTSSLLAPLRPSVGRVSSTNRCRGGA